MFFVILFRIEIPVSKQIMAYQLYESQYDKITKWSVRPEKTQISLGIRPDLSEFLLCTQWVIEVPRFLYADSEDSVQTGRMIWVFAGHTDHFVGFVMLRLNHI